MTISDILDSAAPQGSRFMEALSTLLPLECEFSKDGRTIRSENVPGDNGGLTFAGIDYASHQDFPYKNPKPEDVWKAYWLAYWTPVQAGLMQNPVGEVVFIQAVNQGYRKAIQLLQRALNALGESLTDDGICGPRTIAAVNKRDAHTVAKAFLEFSEDRYERIIERDPSQDKFKDGWDNRIAILRSEYLT